MAVHQAVKDSPLQIEVHRVPFFLEPDFPLDEGASESHMDRMFRKFGRGRSRAQFEQQVRLKTCVGNVLYNISFLFPVGPNKGASCVGGAR